MLGAGVGEGAHACKGWPLVAHLAGYSGGSPMRRIVFMLFFCVATSCSQGSNPVTQDGTVQDVVEDGQFHDQPVDVVHDSVSPDALDLVQDRVEELDVAGDTPDSGGDVHEVVELVGCGDGACDVDEDCDGCPVDCGVCPDVCGDGNCGEVETCETCVADCGSCPAICGNGNCESGEGCLVCPSDCGVCPDGCGDGACENATEGCSSCPEDCGACPEQCGDGVCGVGETCTTCASDCGVCPPICGDGSVNAPGEQCDDGGQEPDDGCDPDCKWELQIGPGVVLITEIMKNPSVVDDTMGEWLELHNTASVPIDLRGWTIRDAGNDLHVIASNTPVTIAAKGFLVLGRNGQPALNGGLGVGYVYSNLNFSNKDDEILLLSADGQEVDRVAYDDGDSFPDTVGAALSLDPLRFDLESNDVGNSWCDATEPYGSGDFGTPGMMNPACPVPVACPNEVCDVGENCLDCPEDCGACQLICGDGLCVPGEGCQLCPTDCGVCPIYCGDKSCNGVETCATCPQDCGYCCGNTLCDNGETCFTCSKDCGTCCGDGVCRADHQEDCATCSKDCGNCSACGNGVCDIGEYCGVCPLDCGACGVCGDGECTQDETCSLCPGDCGFCPSTEWCAPFGIAGATVSCVLRLAADEPMSPRATGLQLDLKFDTTKLEVVKLVDTYCLGSTCVPWEIPPQTILQPTGHTVATNALAGVGQRLLIYHGADPTKPLNDAHLFGQYVIGDPVLLEVRFKLKSTIPAMYPVQVLVLEPRATDADSNVLRVFQLGDGLLVSSVGGLPHCGDQECIGNETCLLCGLDCGSCPEPCGDGVCLGAETCSSCQEDCGECPAVCGDDKCEPEKMETCKTCVGDCGVCPPSCGDAFCNGSETCLTCVEDCGACPPECGDNECNGNESCLNCPGDCGICPSVCENGSCEPQESCLLCPQDCGVCPEPCGDGTCAPLESCHICPEDCGVCPCGNGVCGPNETCGSCAVDCGMCPGCPDGLCNGVETCGSCPLDCGSCPCGDGVCAPDEDCLKCPGDCGLCPFCGDGQCNLDETCLSCQNDCGVCPCGDGVCGTSETCSTCSMDCGPCPECGDGFCDGLETCSSCEQDCGSCPAEGWCQVYGNITGLFECQIALAASSVSEQKATGLQFTVFFNQSKVNMLHFHDEYCDGASCLDWDIPPQSTLQPTGHSLVYEDQGAAGKKVLLYHGSLPHTALSTAYLSGGEVSGDPVVMTLVFRLLTQVPASEAVTVTLGDLRATTGDAQRLSVSMSEGVLITSEQ